MAAKLTYDYTNRYLVVNNGITDLDAQVDIYSDWKEDFVTGTFNRGMDEPIRTVGGDPITSEKALGDSYFLTNNWTIRPSTGNYELVITGNLFAEEGEPIFTAASGTANVLGIIERSSEVLAIETGGDIATGTFRASDRVVLEALLKYLENRQEIDEGTSEMVTYEDDDVAEFARQTLRDPDGNFIVLDPGSIARRGKSVK